MIIKSSLQFWLSCCSMLGTSINSSSSQFSLQAATIKKERLPQLNQPRPNLYSYEEPGDVMVEVVEMERVAEMVKIKKLPLMGRCTAKI